MMHLLDKIPEKSWIVLAYCLGIGFTIISTAAAIIIVRSSNFSYTDKDTEIKLSSDRVKQISNDVDYANEVLQEKLVILESEIDRLQGEDTLEIKQSIEQLKPVAKEIEKNNQELKELSDFD